MKIKCKKLYSALFILGFTTAASAEEPVFTDKFDEIKGWHVSNPDVVRITDDKKLLISNDSGNVSLMRQRVDVSGNYTLTFEAAAKAFSDKYKDAFGVKLHNGSTKLELRFRNNAVYGVSPKEGGGHTYNKLFEIDSQSHQYKVIVSGAVATVSIDGKQASDFNLAIDDTKAFIFLFNRGASGDVSEVIVDNVVITNN